MMPRNVTGLGSGLGSQLRRPADEMPSDVVHNCPEPKTKNPKPQAPQAAQALNRIYTLNSPSFERPRIL